MLTYWLIFGIILTLGFLFLLIKFVFFRNRTPVFIFIVCCICFVVPAFMLIIALLATPISFRVYEYYKPDEISRSKNIVFAIDSLGVFYSENKKFYDQPDSLICIGVLKKKNFYNGLMQTLKYIEICNKNIELK